VVCVGVVWGGGGGGGGYLKIGVEHRTRL